LQSAPVSCSVLFFIQDEHEYNGLMMGQLNITSLGINFLNLWLLYLPIATCH